MKKILLLFSFFLFFHTAKSQNLYFPPLTGSTWDTLSPTSLGWCTPMIDTLIDYLGSNDSKAFLLLKDGKIVIEHYYGTFTKDSLWYWASAAKTLTAFTVGIAQQEGLLSIQDTSSDYMGTGWTDCPLLKEQKITIRNQLTMTTGLDDGVADNHCTLDTCLQYLADAGTRWAYHNAPYTLLDSVLESATGQSLNSYINAKVKVPTGMNGLFVPSGYDNLFVSTPRSMARFGLMILNHGNWNGTQIMTDTAYFNQMVNTSQNLNPSYGYLWWLNGKSSFMAPGFQFSFPGPINPNGPSDLIMALGKNGQMLNVVPSMNLVYLRMGNAPASGDVPIALNDSVWGLLNQIMCNTTAISEAKATEFTVFPNPVKNTLQIRTVESAYSIQLFSLDGRMALSGLQLSGDAMVPVDALESGVYMLRLTNASGYVQIKKILITKN
jgi:CubicO group peptidase (beta-lactamase class C family)